MSLMWGLLWGPEGDAGLIVSSLSSLYESLGFP
jgi:hypothetical protein